MKPYKRSSDGLWVGVIDLGRDGAGRRDRRTVSAKRRSDVIVKLRALQKDLDDGLTQGAAERTTVAQWLDHWLETIASERLRPKVRRTYGSVIRNQINPSIGQYRLRHLTPANVRKMHADITEAGRSRSTVASAHAVLKSALRDAHRDGVIARNILDMMDAPRVGKLERPTLTSDQARHLIRTAIDADDPMSVRWAVALMLGVRQGEALGLEWDRVNFAEGSLNLSWSLTQIPHRHGCGGNEEDGWGCGRKRPSGCPARVAQVPPAFPYRPLHGCLGLTPPKTEGSARLMPLLKPLADALTQYRESVPPNKYGLVWVNKNGHPLNATTDGLAWAAALARADLPRVPLHAARHTTATLLLEADVPITIISRILGHSETRTTERYAHITHGLASAALSNLDGLLEL